METVESYLKMMKIVIVSYVINSFNTNAITIVGFLEPSMILDASNKSSDGHICNFGLTTKEPDA